MDLPLSHSSSQAALSSRVRAASKCGSISSRSSGTQGAPVASRYPAAAPQIRAALRISPLAAATPARTSRAKPTPDVWALSSNTRMASAQRFFARSGSFRESARNPRRLLLRPLISLSPIYHNCSWAPCMNASARSYSPVIAAVHPRLWVKMATLRTSPASRARLRLSSWKAAARS
jgi:hypothetical protein